MTDSTYVQPERGAWPWRELLPADLIELAELRRRTLAAVEAGTVTARVAERFIGWAWAEMENAGAGGRANSTESTYRRLLATLVSPQKPLSGPENELAAKRRTLTPKAPRIHGSVARTGSVKHTAERAA
jgi:hypothetical protein